MCFFTRHRHLITSALVPDFDILDFRSEIARIELEKFGFPYNKIRLLCECGLVSEERVVSEYNFAIDSQNPKTPIEFNGKAWLFHDEQQQYGPNNALRIPGTPLTAVGRELMRLVDREPADEFAKDVEQRLLGMGIKMVELPPELK